MFYRGVLLFVIPCHLIQFQLMGCNTAPAPRWIVKSPVQEVSVRVSPTESSSELVLQLEYELDPAQVCEEGGIARIEYQGRVIRANLLPEVSMTQVALGKSSQKFENLELKYVASEGCNLKKLKVQVSSASQRVLGDRRSWVERLAQQHSPFIVVRPDQKTNPFTDIPLDLAFSIIHNFDRNSDSIRYTAYFSDEDSIGNVSGTDSQMEKYGRRTDIEWVYEVELDSEHQVIHRKYQGGYLFGIGHRTLAFEGQFLEGSEHPVLYDIADHNVFSDSSSSSSAALEGYHFVPQHQIESPEAREWVMFRNPWMFQVSDRELAREKKLSRPSTDYLYLLMEGDQSSGQSFTAIPVEQGISRLDHLPERFQKLKSRILRYFRLKKTNPYQANSYQANTYQMEELTRSF